jgi:hypothetical protein
MRSRAIGALLFLGCVPLSPLLGQQLTARTELTQALLGDPVVVRVRLLLAPGQELVSPVAQPLVPTPDGVDYLGGDSLRPVGDGILEGSARFAFFRLGQQPIPTLALLYRSARGAPLDTLVHSPIALTIVGLANARDATLKDIRPLAGRPDVRWLPFVILAGVVLAGVGWFRRRSASRPRQTDYSPLPAADSPFTAALATLDRVENAARGSEDGAVDLIAGMAGALREALVASGMAATPGFTTTELRSIVGDTFAGESGAVRCHELFQAADLVRFARVHPDRATALAYLSRARELLRDWERDAGVSREDLDAVR